MVERRTVERFLGFASMTVSLPGNSIYLIDLNY